MNFMRIRIRVMDYTHTLSMRIITEEQLNLVQDSLEEHLLNTEIY